MSRLFIFVEGDDDERFFSRILVSLFQQSYHDIRIVKYAGMNPEKVQSFIKSVDSMPDSDYIFVADHDQHPCVTSKKDWIANKYATIDIHRMLIVVEMIEGWYLAGVSDQHAKKLGLKPPYTTHTITKEAFKKLIPKKYPSRIDFMVELLNSYSLHIAKDRNASLNYTLTKYRLL